MGRFEKGVRFSPHKELQIKAAQKPIIQKSFSGHLLTTFAAEENTMSVHIKNREAILSKLGIEKLNPMQVEATEAIHTNDEIVLLSPTGTGKTLAFSLPIIAELDPENPEVQVLILVPSRELAIQIEQVIREMGTGYKTNAVYGGRAGSKDRIELKHRPAILIGTPGRIADHLRRGTIDPASIKTLVLDEFDKSLEIGFTDEMSEICGLLPEVKKRLLTSATPKVTIPSFVGLKDPKYVNYLEDGVPMLDVKILLSPDKDKLDTLVAILEQLGDQPGIVFCNFKESINRVSEYLDRHNIAHGTFYGGMEQKDRERALIKFRNGTYNIILATDLAARGLDIPELKFIIHYHLPLKKHEFTHRNGRTARMNSEGSAYILQYEKERLPDFIRAINPPVEDLEDLPSVKKNEAIVWETIFVSGGRKDKISKGDIAGLFIKQGGLANNQLGVIEIKQDCAFVAVDQSKVDTIIQKLDNARLKKKKVRITRIG